MIVSGQLACASGAPCAASSFSSDASTAEPGILTEPGTGSATYSFLPLSVTSTLPFAPLAQVTEHWNCSSSSDGHLAVETFALAVESCCLIWLSTDALDGGSSPHAATVISSAVPAMNALVR